MKNFKVARFSKISEESYNKICKENPLLHFTPYNKIKLPTRATQGSAGYDFYITQRIQLNPKESTIIDTFIRCEMVPGCVLMVFPKSGLGFKYNLTLSNTVGIIDSDYFYTKSDDPCNEGNIRIKLKNCGFDPVILEEGSKFCQGLFIPFGVTVDDDINAKSVRNGGFGSTGE